MKTALLIVDFQNDYFPTFNGAKFPLHQTEQAADKAAKLLAAFRSKGLPVVHVRHVFQGENAPFFGEGTQGAEIHASVAPIEGEAVVIKHQINSFRDTELLEILKKQGIEKLIVAGAMSHMCIDAAVRAACDFGFQCAVAHDACATRDLEFNGKVVPAEQVHAAYMAALAFAYAQTDTAENLINELK
ncbi:cysteine hydrolase family protein [Neisseria sp.]|uniref:cysteine hydrolase family protein n=1 Tax=Neisseria sp. TaxID=192066 RepID=UPI0035A0BF38